MTEDRNLLIGRVRAALADAGHPAPLEKPMFG